MLFVFATLFASFADYPLSYYFIFVYVFSFIIHKDSNSFCCIEEYLLKNWFVWQILFIAVICIYYRFYNFLHKHQLLSIHIVKDMREKRICYSSFINYIRTFYQRAIYPKGLLLSSFTRPSTSIREMRDAYLIASFALARQSN